MFQSLPVLEEPEEREGELISESRTYLEPGSLDIPEALILKHV